MSILSIIICYICMFKSTSITNIYGGILYVFTTSIHVRFCLSLSYIKFRSGLTRTQTPVVRSTNNLFELEIRFITLTGQLESLFRPPLTRTRTSRVLSETRVYVSDTGVGTVYTRSLPRPGWQPRRHEGSLCASPQTHTRKGRPTTRVSSFKDSEVFRPFPLLLRSLTYFKSLLHDFFLFQPSPYPPDGF